ncbi:MAG: sigma-70 family RNA polymerase sigma factor [Pseudomonadales bacterium]|nr:sigma-70 family RNA polymerase sigma factor [Pseudomonadales bacterium]
MSDDQLLHAYVRGQDKAFDILYEKYKQSLYGYFYRNCDSSMVDELFQDVWLRVIASSRRYQNQNKFRSWLFTLAHNCLVDHYRRQSLRVSVSSDESEVIDAEFNTPRLVESEKLGLDLLKAIDSLPFEQKEVFFLREESGFSIKDIAKIQDISNEAAKSRLRYAYGKLRILLKEASI